MPLANKEVIHLRNGWERIQVISRVWLVVLLFVRACVLLALYKNKVTNGESLRAWERSRIHVSHVSYFSKVTNGESLRAWERSRIHVSHVSYFKYAQIGITKLRDILDKGENAEEFNATEFMGHYTYVSSIILVRAFSFFLIFLFFGLLLCPKVACFVLFCSVFFRTERALSWT